MERDPTVDLCRESSLPSYKTSVCSEDRSLRPQCGDLGNMWFGSHRCISHLSELGGDGRVRFTSSDKIGSISAGWVVIMMHYVYLFK